MKKLALIICTLLLLCGCSSNMFSNNNITGLLSSPKHSQTESDIAKAIGDYLGENITLKYSQNQGYSAPIQFIDIDDDAVEEALVFYYAPNKGTNIRFALADIIDGQWNVVFDKEGLGTDVFYFDTVVLGNLKGRQILVGYLPQNISENFFVTYFTDQSAERADYTEVCEDILVGDVNEDNQDDIILTSRLSEGNIRIKVLSFTQDNAFKVAGVKTIRRTDAQITQLAISKTSDGKTALYVDYIDSYNKMYTEASTVYSNIFINCINKEYVSRIWAYTNKLNSCDIDGDGVQEIPVVLQDSSEEELPVLKYIGWNDYSSNEMPLKSFGVYNTAENIYIALPSEWQELTHTEYTGNLWRIKSIDDETPLVSFYKEQSNKNTQYSPYRVQIGTESWKIEFSEELDQSQKDYIMNSIVVFK